MPDEYDSAAFDPPVAGKRPTSKKAAADIAPKVGTVRRRVYDFICDRGDEGATREEIELALGMNGNSVHPRVLELRKAGLVIVTDRRRKTRAGHDAEVIVASALV